MRFPMWSSRFRRVFVNSTWRLNMTSDGTSWWISEHPWSPFMRTCKGAIVSAHGLPAIAVTRFIIRSASRAGGTISDGNGCESKEMHAERYFSNISSRSCPNCQFYENRYLPQLRYQELSPENHQESSNGEAVAYLEK